MYLEVRRAAGLIPCAVAPRDGRAEAVRRDEGVECARAIRFVLLRFRASRQGEWCVIQDEPDLRAAEAGEGA